MILMCHRMCVRSDFRSATLRADTTDEGAPHLLFDVSVSVRSVTRRRFSLNHGKALPELSVLPGASCCFELSFELSQATIELILVECNRMESRTAIVHSYIWLTDTRT